MKTETGNIGPDQLERPLGEIRFLRIPDSRLFTRRAERLKALAKGHSVGEYLSFIALLAEAQQEVLDQFPPVRLSEPDERHLCPDSRSHQRHPVWRKGLAEILERMDAPPLPMAAKKAVTDLLAAPASRIEELADLILQGELEPVDPRIMPFVAAGLQVYWVRMSREPRGPDSGNLKIPGVCPVCGSAPNAGIVLGDGPEKGLRYLCCSLCSTQWHTVRLTCSNCEATSGMTYYVIEGSGGAVKAECCNTCGTYLKLLYLEKDGEMDPIADDLSTMTLDMLLDGEGVVRCGPNLMYHPGG